MVGETVDQPFDIAVRCFFGVHEWKYGTWREDMGQIPAGQKVKACIHCSKVEFINHFEPPPVEVFH